MVWVSLFQMPTRVAKPVEPGGFSIQILVSAQDRDRLAKCLQVAATLARAAEEADR
jgi:hypothetical protein